MQVMSNTYFWYILLVINPRKNTMIMINIKKKIRAGMKISHQEKQTWRTSTQEAAELDTN